MTTKTASRGEMGSRARWRKDKRTACDIWTHYEQCYIRARWNRPRLTIMNTVIVVFAVMGHHSAVLSTLQYHHVCIANARRGGSGRNGRGGQPEKHQSCFRQSNATNDRLPIPGLGATLVA